MPSMAIDRFTYDGERGELRVLFRSGRAYIYHDVPSHIVVAMQEAFAKGKFFNAEIRNRFRSTRLARTEPPATLPFDAPAGAPRRAQMRQASTVGANEVGKKAPDPSKQK